MISGSLKLEKVGSERPNWWRLLAPVIYVDSTNPALRIIAPIGFETDLLSIPRFAAPFFSRTGIAAEAGTIHDAGYAGKAELSAAMKLRFPRGLTRKQWDMLLYVIAIELGMSRLKASLMWAGVRVRGGARWKHCRSGK